MKKYFVTLCALALVTAATAAALGLPGGGGGKIDTKKFDELIASIEEIAGTFETATGKIDECQTTLAGIAEAHGISDLFSDPAKITELKEAITDDDKAALQAQIESLQTVPDDLSAAVEAAAGLAAKVPEALTDLATQITKNPLAAKDLKEKQSQLEAGKTALEKIGTDGPALVESATNLSSTIGGML